MAQFNLAAIYFQGAGVPQKETKAIYCLNHAAKQGHSRAQDFLRYLSTQ